MRMNLGAACSETSYFPNGCPSGFTLQPIYGLASNGQLVSPSTPGAVPGIDASGCPIYFCLNPNYQTPTMVANAGTPAATSSAVPPPPTLCPAGQTYVAPTTPGAQYTCASPSSSSSTEDITPLYLIGAGLLGLFLLLR